MSSSKMVDYSPNTSLEYGKKLASCEDEDRVVISGISGTYPNCENILELEKALFEKKDLITDVPELNFSAGKIKNVGKFDAQFFGITHEHADYMDPMCRILLEKAYEAIADSGYNMNHFTGKTVGVYVANCTSDAEIESTYRTDIKGALICERAQSFLANRISYWLGVNGPSCTINTACSSSLYALELAYKAIRNGECDAALVGASNLSLAPGMVNLYVNLGITSSRCRSFDNSANGFCRSEAISVLLLQKMKHARRVYAQVVHIKTNNDGYKKQTILFPSSTMQTKLINEIYQECGIPKSNLSWVEAHGTGTRIGDYQEMKSLETLCEGRNGPLLCGCVKSSIGHTEATSGLCSIAKVIIAMERGLIPPNINFNEPQKGITALQENKIRIILETTPWSGGYVAVNNFGIGGSNAHLLLKSNIKNKETSRYSLDALFMVAISGRTAESVSYLTDYLISNPLDIELINLLHQIYSSEIPRHPYRGYVIFNKNFTIKSQHVQRINENSPQLWFIYPGMGSQWPTMAKQLLKLECFRQSIQECHYILQSKNLNLMEIITTDDARIFENILHCFIGLTSMMIALTDLLENIGLKPDGLIGHSFGEIGCAYADKCLTKKQAIEVAYYRGLSSKEMKTINGSMAAIGLSSEVVKKKCPSSVEVVCYNGANSCTVAGPSDAVRELVMGLKSERVFATEVYSANIAYHSRYIKHGGSIYHDYLQKVITSPKERSNKWISTSIDEEKCNSEINKTCSAEYFVNNFLQPVNFERALKQISGEAITLEIAPHSILKNALNETLNDKIVNIGLLNKNHSDPLHHLLLSLGSLYENNVNMDISKLYPPIEYPVSRGTPMIAPLIKWNHDEDWHIPFQNLDLHMNATSNGKLHSISYDNDEFLYLRGHVIDGANVLPVSLYLEMVWDTFTERRKVKDPVSVIFRNIHFNKVVHMPTKGSLNFDITITRKSGYFEVVLDNEVICYGYIVASPDVYDVEQDIYDQEEALVLQSDSVYKELNIKGYTYTNHFQNILCSNLEGTNGKIKWTNNWILFIEALVQFLYFYKTDKSFVEVVTQIDNLRIDTSKHLEYSKKFKNEIPLSLTRSTIICGGIIIKGITTQKKEREKCMEPMLQKFQFTPYFNKKPLSIENMIRILITIILENTLTSEIKIIEYPDDCNIPVLSKEIDKYLKVMSFFKADVTVHDEYDEIIKLSDLPSYFKLENILLENHTLTNLLILSDLKKNFKILDQSMLILNNGAFILTREKIDEIVPSIEGLQISATYLIEDEKLILWHKAPIYESPLILRVDSYSFAWVKHLQKILKENKSNNIVIYSEHDAYSGIIGFYKCIRREASGRNIRCYLILDNTAPAFSLDHSFYIDQLKLHLAINVYKNGSWGTYIPFETETPSSIKVPRVYLDVNDEENDRELYWSQGEMIADTKKSDENQHQLIHIHYVTLPDNYSQHLARMQDDPILYEFSGKTAQGVNVAGISLHGRISNILSENQCIYWNLPKEYSLEEGLTLPAAYLTALMVLMKVRKNEPNTILIQNGHSDIGQALIYLLLSQEYTLFTAEKTKSEKEYIESKFIEIQSFCQDSLFQVTGKIDLLLLTEFDNSTADLIEIVTNNGHIFYTGETRSLRWELLENAILKGKHFETISLSNLLSHDSKKLSLLRELLDFEMKHGITKPVERKKITLPVPTRIKNSKNEFTTNSSIQLIIENEKRLHEVKPKFNCYSEYVYIICGGLGGMGFELAHWLVKRGAKKIFLVSRTGKCNGYQLREIAKWESSGIFIKITTDNISTSEGVVNLLKSANQIGIVTAIFNTTLILQDGLFENLSENDFQTVAYPKAIATIHLDKMSRIMCPYLNHFVVFSSIVCGYGNAGQTNYGYANSVIERICEMRRSQGLPGLAIEWAGVGDVGYLSNTPVDKLPSGTQLQPIRSCLQVLEQFLCQSDAIVSSFIISKEESTHKSHCDTAFVKIKKILDQASSSIPPNTTLRDIGLDSITITETKIILERKFNIIMNTNDILDLRLYELWNIEKQSKPARETNKPDLNYLSILENIYSNLFQVLAQKDNIEDPSPIVRLESYLHEGKTNYVAIDEEPTIFFLPSIEGFAAVMQPLASNVDLQVLCAQYDPMANDVKKIASTLLQEIEKKLSSDKEFHMLGYSYGGLIAMEIAYILEQKGRTGYLYIIDSSPIIVKSISKALFVDHGFHLNILGFMRSLKMDIDMTKFEKQLYNIKDWKSVLKFTMESLPDDVKLGKDFLQIILNISYERNYQILSYEAIPKNSLKSKVFFFKPKESLFPMPSSHGFSEYCETPVEEYLVSGNHFTMLKTTELAHYIMTLYRGNSKAKNSKY